MDISSFIFSALPVALYALDNYQRCLKPVKDYWKYESTLKRIRSHVFLQQEQLDATMSHLGLTRPTEKELRARLQEVYPGKCDIFMEILEEMRKSLERLMRNLDVDYQGKPNWSDALPDRIDWEWRRVKRSFSRRRRDELIRDLDYWNAGLRRIVERPEIPFPEEQSPSAGAKVLVRLTPQQCESIRKDLGLIKEAFQNTGWTCNCSEHRALIRLAWHLERTASSGRVKLSFRGSAASLQLVSVNVERDQDDGMLKAPVQVVEQLSQQISAHSAQASPQFSPPLAAVNLKPRSRIKLLSFRPNKRVDIVENSPAAAPRSELTSSRYAARHPQIPCMCRFINDSIAPQYGVIQLEREGNRFVVRVSKDSATDTEPAVYPLKSLLQNSRRQQPSGSGFALSRRHRFEIAAAVSWAALYLCGTSWFESGWGVKDDLHVFLRTEGKANRAVVLDVHPSISHVFKQSSADVPLEGTAPGFGTGQIRNRTLFNLGILLLELCLGQTFEQISNEARRPASEGGLPLSSQAASVAAPLSDYEVANQLLDEVYLAEGELYGDALRRCLRCEFPGRDSTKDFDYQSFRRDFLFGVVQPLQATFESCIH